MKAIIDCNSFYAACERVFKPSLHGKPVVVLSNNDGCIVSRSDEAKALGIQMAGPYYEVKEILAKNHVHVFSSNYHLYGDMSWRVMETLRILCCNVEVYSVDESFVDLNYMNESDMWGHGLMIRNTVERWTGIPVSVGIAPTKTLAKVANRMAKKNKKQTQGTVALLSANDIYQALENTRIVDIWGVGRRNAEKLQRFGINNARKHLGGVVGVRLIRELKGEACIEMKDPLKTKKMIATTRMFGKAVFELNDLKEAIATYTTRAAEKLRRQNGAAAGIHVFVVTNDISNGYQYNPISRGLYVHLPKASSASNELIGPAIKLVEQLYRKGLKYLKAGVILSSIVPDSAIQCNLFESDEPKNLRGLMNAVDNINFSMRDDVVKFATSGTKRNWKMRQEMRSPRYSTRWDEIKEVK